MRVKEREEDEVKERKPQPQIQRQRLKKKKILKCASTTGTENGRESHKPKPRLPRRCESEGGETASATAPIRRRIIAILVAAADIDRLCNA